MIHPVILCGGAGTRLWPLSRRDRPKQFAALAGPQTLFRQTLERLSGPGFAPPLVMTGAAFRFLAGAEIEAAGIDGARILIEPAPRNTAPAVVTAALALAETPGALMLVAPSDHAIADRQAFAAAVAAARPLAEAGRLVTFGIAPDRAETGYGWLALSAPAEPGVAQDLDAFVEKPDRATAEAMLAGGRHLWNAGIFLFRADALLAAVEAHAPGLLAPCRAGLAGGQADLDFFRLGPGFAEAADISLDHAVMEKAAGLAAVPVACGWSDLGAWDAVWRVRDRDAAGVAAEGAVTALDCRDSLLVAAGPGQHLVGLGLEGLAVIAMRDAVLVAPLDRAQEVKRAVAALAAAGVPQAVESPRAHRPWGWYESMLSGPRFQVKRLHVAPGGRLSLQSHHHRAEHWVVVTGTAEVTIGEHVHLLTENQSVYVPLGVRHRLANPGRIPLDLIEVQSGSYLGEDDIVRFEDIYARE